MKTAEELKPNFGPIYAAALYPELASVCHKHGYALACHGSLARDFDLIAVPWADEVSHPIDVLNSITATFAVQIVGAIAIKPHGRIAHTISIGFGTCQVDFSFIRADRYKPVQNNETSITKRNPDVV